MTIAPDTHTYAEKVKKAAANVLRALLGKDEVTLDEMTTAGMLARELEEKARLLAISIEFEARNQKQVVKV